MNKRKLNRFVFSFLFLMPGMLLFLGIIIYPTIETFFNSFVDWNGIGAKTFTGLRNYKDIFVGISSRSFFTCLKNNMLLIGCSLLFGFPASLLFAYFAYTLKRAENGVKMIIFMPRIVSNVVMGLLWMLLFNGSIGPVNYLLKEMGLAAFQRDWLSDASVSIWVVTLTQVWQGIGYNAMLLNSGMHGIDESIIESAQIDGANTVVRFFHIVIPQIYNYVCVVLMLSFINSMKTFEHTWTMTNGGPGDATSYLATLMYKLGFSTMKYGRASAVTMTILAICVLFTVVFKKLQNMDIQGTAAMEKAARKERRAYK